MTAADSPSRIGAPAWADLLERFEQERHGARPRPLEEFLAQHGAAGPAAGSPAARRLLEELIKIDLECAWRQRRGTPPRLEDYVRRFPTLAVDGLAPELIGEEYRVRQRWGDRPQHAEYLTRFAGQASAVIDVLRRIDGALSAEFQQERAPAVAADADDVLLHAPRGGPAVAPLTTAQALVETLRQTALLPDKVKEVLAQLQTRSSSARALAGVLVQRDLLTPFQANQLLRGHGPELVLASYILLERLGQGGAGQVFKARHQKMGRLVAIKVLRRELVADPEVVGRFYREIQVLSHLNHPHIVRAYDAGPVGPTHFLAMEFVEGTDLNRLVKRQGPLPVPVACAYIRQAALGLQYAHEQGLVHRDIKPANLLVSGGVVSGESGGSSHHSSLTTHQIKILDLGLARLPHGRAQPGGTTPLADGETILTPTGAVLMMGTPDYLAPEQALDFHGADIRSDIYSLGCSLFFLLSGQPPFAGGTVAQKLMRHQQAAAPDLTLQRGDVPLGVAALLRRTMAKRPEDRYATPGELAEALTPFCHADGARPRPRLTRRWLLIAAGAGAVLAGAGLLLARPWRSPTPALPIMEREGDAAAALAKLRTYAQHPNRDTEGLRQRLLELRTRFAGSAEAREANLWLMELPAPLDALPEGDSPVRGVVRVLPPRSGQATLVAFSPDARLIALGGPGGTVHLIDAAKESPPNALAAAGNTVTSLAFSPDGRLLAAGSDNGAIKLWDLTARQDYAVFDDRPGGPISVLAFSPDARTLAVAIDGKNEARLWDVPAKQAKKTRITEISPTVVSLAFHPDGKVLAVGGAHRPYRYYDVTTGQFLREGDSAPARNALAFSPDGEVVAAWNSEHVGPYFCQARTWQRICRDARQRGYIAADYLPNGMFVAASAAGNVSLYDVLSRYKLDPHERAVKPIKEWELGTRLRGASLAGDGRHVACLAENGTVFVLRLVQRSGG